MLKERLSVISEPQQTPQPLDSSFLIRKEINSLRAEPDFTYEEQREYLYDQKIHFLNEHAGYVDVSQLKGTLSESGNLIMSHKDMNTSWEKTIAEYGIGSREHYEIIGWQRATEKLVNDEVNCVIISSPQKWGFNRRFTFILLKEGDNITQINAMHKGADVLFERAAGQYRSLQFLSGDPSIGKQTPQTINEMITQPITFNATPEQLKTIHEILEITEAKQIESKKYQRALQIELKEMLEDYMTIMQGLIYADFDNEEDEYAQTLLLLAKKYRKALYIKAEQIKERLQQEKDIDKKTFTYTKPEKEFANSFEEMQFFVDNYPEPQIRGGASCPTSSSAATNISELLAGNTMHTALLKSEFGSFTGENAKNDPNLCRCSKGGGPHFHCPGKVKDENGKEKKCEHPIIVGEGTTKCPTCGMGKQC